MAESWLRNWIACMAMYYTVGALWAYYIYWCFGNVFFGPGKMPGIEDVWNQIQVSPHRSIFCEVLTAVHMWQQSFQRGPSCLDLTRDNTT